MVADAPTTSSSTDTNSSEPNSLKSVQDLFERVVELIRKTNSDASNNVTLSQAEQLRLYGLYKRCTEGRLVGTASSDSSSFPSASNSSTNNCRGKEDMEDAVVCRSRPSFLQITSRYKYDAWLECSTKYHRKHEARLEYMECALKLLFKSHSVNKDEVNMLHQELRSCITTADPDRNQSSTMEEVEITHDRIRTTTRFSPLRYLIDSLKLYPRGTLDISWNDFLFATYYSLLYIFFSSFFPSSKEESIYQGLNERIELLWNEQNESNEDDVKPHILTSLSVRSAFDLYLQAKQYPPGSSIVMSAIQIEGMIRVAQYHGLTIIPVDCSSIDNVAPSISMIMEKVTSSTVAVLIAHAFGFVGYSEQEFQRLKEQLQQFDHAIDLLEDCAECYPYRGSSFSDIVFVSFGVIKTSTALGGAVSIVHSHDVYTKMKQLQMRYKQKTSTYFLIHRVLKCSFLHWVSHSPLLCGILCKLCQHILGDASSYDRIITNSIKGFPLSSSKHSTKLLIQLLRYRPSCANLALLYRRISSPTTAGIIQSRANRCRQMIRDISLATTGTTKFPGCEGEMDTATCDHHHYYWLLPFMVKNPDFVSQRLLKAGFDVPRGTSQLGCVENFLLIGSTDIKRSLKNDHSCPIAADIMSNILYLPVASYSLSRSTSTKLVDAIKEATAATCSTSKTSHQNITITCQEKIMNRRSYMIVSALAVLLGTPLSAGEIMSTCFLLLFYSIISVSALILVIGIVIRFLAPVYLESSVFQRSIALSRDKNEIDGSISPEHDPGMTTTDEKNVDSTLNTAINSDIGSFHLEDVESLNFQKCGYIQSNSDVSLPNSLNPKVLLTGATGFVGSMILHDLLRYREELGLFGGVVLLCRSKGNVTAKERIHQLLKSPMFSFLASSEKEYSSILTVIECEDLSHPNFGLTEINRQNLSEMNITHVIHCAAAVSFLQSLDDAAHANITPALQIQEFIRRSKWTAKYVHISTAFVHGPLTGSMHAPLPENPFSLGKYNPYDLYKSMMGTQSLASVAMHELGFPNTYTFSKCICEHLLLKETSINTIIIRPSIVGPSAIAPWEGWAGSKPSTFIAAACLFLKNQWSIWSFGAKQVAVIPVDVVSRFIVRKSFYKESDPTKRIFNATWNSFSPEIAWFTWKQFSETMVKLGSIQGKYSRLTSCLFYFLNNKIIPSLEICPDKFSILHQILVRTPFEIMASVLSKLSPKRAERIKYLLKFIDLPILFLHFSSSSFYFFSELQAPLAFNGQRYMINCCYAADAFTRQISDASASAIPLHHHIIAGKHHITSFSDFWWAVTQPVGNVAVRVAGYLIIKLLRYSADEVVVDLTSFARLSNFLHKEELKSGVRPHIVLAPTHRSFYDFLLISYLCFSVPELGIPVPFICASVEFSHIPILGFLAKCTHAFFVKLGQGKVDADLTTQVRRLKNNGSTTFEVFIEGKRSRDRRFVPGKRGFLKCLQSTGGVHVILPICINYERIPEQAALLEDINGKRRSFFSAPGLFHWLIQVFRGHVRLGSIQVCAAEPVFLNWSSNLTEIVTQIQLKQQSLVKVSNYHVDAGSVVLGVHSQVIRDALQSIGCISWFSYGQENKRKSLPLPNCTTELCTIMLQWGHFLAPFLSELGRDWQLWLNPCRVLECSKSNSNIEAIVTAMKETISEACVGIHATVRLLKSKGFSHPSKSHIIQYISKSSSLPYLFALAAVEFLIFNDGFDYGEEKKETDFEEPFCDEKAIEAPRPIFKINCKNRGVYETSFFDDSEESEAFGAWGFSDSGFVMNVTKNRKVVCMQGDRYRISGREIPKLVPFIEKEIGIVLDPTNTAFRTQVKDYKIEESKIQEEDIKKISYVLNENCERGTLSRVSTNPIDRLRHGTGQTQEDMYILRSKLVEKIRFPDCVVWPVSEKEVVSLVKLAVEEKWCIIPFGGGTNVSHATRCPPRDLEPRPILSVDMRKMNRILWINAEDCCAHIEAGICGRHLVQELERRGLTIGHEPDSIEFSTLGGWIATKASGMKRNKYGNIEDIVKEVTCVSSVGVLFHDNSFLSGHQSHSVIGRRATGMELSPFMLGSEGCLGIITSAVVKVWPIAERKEFECIVLPSFEVGIRFMKDLSKAQSLRPASVRLVDNVQFRLGQSLKEDSRTFLNTVCGKISQLVAENYYGFHSDSVVGITIAFEGCVDELQAQKKHIRKLSSLYGGLLAGSSHGQAGYDLTFAIAYLRDFAMSYHCLGDSFETFAPWSLLEGLIIRTKSRIRNEHNARCLPGKPFISCRVTQVYDEGACVYFYFCMYTKNVKNPSQVFNDIEEAAREEIIKSGGSVSHHHGVGKIRSKFMDKMTPDSLRHVFTQVKEVFDPENVFGARNGIFDLS